MKTEKCGDERRIRNCVFPQRNPLRLHNTHTHRGEHVIVINMRFSGLLNNIKIKSNQIRYMRICKLKCDDNNAPFDTIHTRHKRLDTTKNHNFRLFYSLSIFFSLLVCSFIRSVWPLDGGHAEEYVSEPSWWKRLVICTILWVIWMQAVDWWDEKWYGRPKAANLFCESQSVCVSCSQTHNSFRSAVCLVRGFSGRNVKFTTNASENKTKFNLQNAADPAHVFYFSSRISF